VRNSPYRYAANSGDTAAIRIICIRPGARCKFVMVNPVELVTNASPSQIGLVRS
jgi:hypothetical protein